MEVTLQPITDASAEETSATEKGTPAAEETSATEKGTPAAEETSAPSTATAATGGAEESLDSILTRQREIAAAYESGRASQWRNILGQLARGVARPNLANLVAANRELKKLLKKTMYGPQKRGEKRKGRGGRGGRGGIGGRGGGVGGDLHLALTGVGYSDRNAVNLLCEDDVEESSRVDSGDPGDVEDGGRYVESPWRCPGSPGCLQQLSQIDFDDGVSCSVGSRECCGRSA
ncbi:uncharacterized protein LOC143261980 [Megalopta genalis]|uniref:uncharacterized protein LOC143261980 n=1 Tax=Megalopta genalis TaxID=115081 RepID=UPI003FD5DCCE